MKTEEEMTSAILETKIDALPLVARGKVRDIYAVEDDKLLIVATDRLSAFDVVMPKGIPGKGRILTELSIFWFDLLSDLVPNHLIATEISDYPSFLASYADQLEGRSMLVHRAPTLPVECIARGYLTGSGLKDYRATGAVCGHVLPPGLPEAARLEPPLFTPSTKAEQGDHDENIDFDQAAAVVGLDTANWLRDMTLKVYSLAREHAEARGILIADTKMEFGRLPSGEIILIDEVLTPDASRFWNKDEWGHGVTPASYDKQVVRNYLENLDWGKTAPGPDLPDSIIMQALERYEEIAERLMG